MNLVSGEHQEWPGLAVDGGADRCVAEIELRPLKGRFIGGDSRLECVCIRNQLVALLVGNNAAL